MTNAPAPKLAHLRSFLYVSRHRSISRAATELGVSQPTVTEHIQRLKEGYGRPLFTRGPNGVELTVAGEALKRTVRSSLEQLDRLTFADTPMDAHIGLGGPPDLLSMCVLPALEALYGANVHIRIRPGTAEQLLKQSRITRWTSSSPRAGSTARRCRSFTTGSSTRNTCSSVRLSGTTASRR